MIKRFHFLTAGSFGFKEIVGNFDSGALLLGFVTKLATSTSSTPARAFSKLMKWLFLPSLVHRHLSH